MDSLNKSKVMLICSMIIFGTIGIFRRYIPLESAALAMMRGFIGTVALLVIIFIKKEKIDVKSIGKSMVYLIVSGAFIGVNWILLFESYNHTTVAVATLCYYMAPIFVIIVSPFLLKEKLSLKKAICVAIALLGMVLVSGIIGGQTDGDFSGILFGLGAAVLYASVILLNQKLKGIPAYTKTVFQLGSAAIVILPYVLLTDNTDMTKVGVLAIVMVLVVGLIHTGLAYSLYFGSMDGLKAQTIALFSYIDPVLAIILSAVVLSEKMSVLQIVGTVCVLSATAYSELSE